jgi:two-component system, NtrC family, sensor kinase
MMKPLTNIILFLLILYKAGAQAPSNDIAQDRILKDSLMSVIDLQKGDTNEVRALAMMAILSDSPDSGILFGDRGITLAKSLNDKKGEADCLYGCALRFSEKRNLNQSVFYCLKAVDVFNQIKDYRGVAETELLLQGAYRDLEDYDNALIFGKSGEQLSLSFKLNSKYDYPGHRFAPLFLAEIAGTYLARNQLDSSRFYIQKAIDQNELFHGSVWNFPIYLLGRIQTFQGNYTAAFQNFRKALPLAVLNQFYSDTLQIFSGLSEAFLRTGQLDSAIHFAKIVVLHRYDGETTYTQNAIESLAKAYKLKGEKDSALKYTEFRNFYKDSLQNSKVLIDIQNFSFAQKLKQQEEVAAQLRYKEQLRFYLLASGILIILLISLFQWRNSRQRQKAYALLEKQKWETDQQKEKTEKALSELKATQTQLIQSEKMASLGELTAGIAHEIQNPLNFVNNFSDLNIELTEELENEMKKGDFEKAKGIAMDIVTNQEKISRHGKRAEAIVKNMLQHSRTSTGQKEPADLNMLAEESLRLSYQSAHGKNKNFISHLQTQFDETIGRLNINPQDFRRVFLNLFHNAFYAVQEKANLLPKEFPGEGSNRPEYIPAVSVTTKRVNNNIEIIVKDNGIGVAQKVIDKIFQPFFTTKPPGQGTGLGLSMSYDIIKSYGGQIKVNSREGEFTEFCIELPIELNLI